jgi:hypothetical protein
VGFNFKAVAKFDIDRIINRLMYKLKNRKTKLPDLFKVDENYQEIFQYDYLRTFDNSSHDHMIRFHFVKNANQLIGKLLILFKNLGLKADGIDDIWMNDEIWIKSKSHNGQVIITKDIYDFVFMLGPNNKFDLDKIEETMSHSIDFKRIIINETK